LIKQVIRKTFYLLVIIFLITSCKYFSGDAFGRGDNVTTRASDLTVISKPSAIASKSTYSFLVVTDLHFGGDFTRHEDELYKWIKNKSSDERPSFCICLGDIADHGYSSEVDSYNKFVSYLDTEFSMKTYTVVGNHDLYNSGWQYFKDNIYPNTSCYRFETDKYSYYFLDNASGTFGKKQYDNLTTQMANDSKEKIVSFHIPLYTETYEYFLMQNEVERNRFITLFASNNVKLVLSGHTHYNLPYDIGPFYIYNVPALKYASFLVVHVDETNQNLTWELVSL
jgi:Icc protein